MKQDNHEAHDDTVHLDAETADHVRDALNDYDAGDEGDAFTELLETLESVANEDESVRITPEQAKLAADFLRERNGGSDEHEHLLEKLDAVANQHGGAPTASSADQSGEAEHD